MNWFRAVNSYCERTDASYWSEPLNALTNLAFVVAAVAAWRYIGDRSDPGARALAVLLGLIGVGSFLFHTHAQVWSLFADVIPIQLFILAMLYLSTVRFFGVSGWVAGALAVAFLPSSALLSRILTFAVGSLNGSTSYVPVPLLILAYALALRRRKPKAARGLAIGAGILIVSLGFRTADAAVCPIIPFGTHFVWHLLNAVMLWWMIRVVADASAAPWEPDLARSTSAR